jgi:methionyl-tRNA formyltransferase
MSRKFKLAIFGKHISTDFLVKELHTRAFPKPVAVISPDSEYLRDRRLLSPFGLYSNLEGLEAQGLVEIYKAESVNTKEVITLLGEKGCAAGFSISCRNIIKRPLIDFFQGAIFNLHDSYLPDERGGALNSWRILNNVTEVGDTIHYLTEGIDSGPVVLRSKMSVGKTHPLPIDYLVTSSENCNNLIREFLDLLEGVTQATDIDAVEQDHDLSDYFPRLFTEHNGLIDWDWNTRAVERFIRAFSTPYPGAHSYYRGQKLHILEAIAEDPKRQSYHPFCNGRILTVCQDQSVRVIAGGNAVRIEKVALDGEISAAANVLECKYSLVSPANLRQSARGYIPTTKQMNEQEES